MPPSDRSDRSAELLSEELEAKLLALHESLWAPAFDACQCDACLKLLTSEPRNHNLPILRVFTRGIRSEDAKTIDALRLSHPGEGTILCTCSSYPHDPNCGLDQRLINARAALLASQQSAEALSEALESLLSTWEADHGRCFCTQETKPCKRCRGHGALAAYRRLTPGAEK